MKNPYTERKLRLKLGCSIAAEWVYLGQAKPSAEILLQENCSLEF